MIWWGGQLPDRDALTALGSGSLAGALGIAFVAAGDDWLSARMPVDERTRQPFGRLHGGASVALAETVASVAGALAVDPSRFRVVGLEINANHLRPAFNGHVEATARAESLGRTVQVWTIRIEDEARRLVCLSRFTAAVIAADRS
jgi:1,4-dihydroxy-2-naphthoyl-CoA hydrolase